MRVGAVLAVAMVMGAAPAWACQPPQPPPRAPVAAPGTPEADARALATAWDQAHAVRRAEEFRAYRLSQQTDLFDKAARLVVVRVERQGVEGLLDGGRTMPPPAVLKPVRWLKGKGEGSELRLAWGPGPHMCAPMAAYSAFIGKPGEVFLVYLSGDTLRQQDVLEAFAIDHIIEPRAIAALTKWPE
jgi:hypothetical protein